MRKFAFGICFIILYIRNTYNVRQNSHSVSGLFILYIRSSSGKIVSGIYITQHAYGCICTEYGDELEILRLGFTHVCFVTWSIACCTAPILLIIYYMFRWEYSWNFLLILYCALCYHLSFEACIDLNKSFNERNWCRYSVHDIWEISVTRWNSSRILLLVYQHTHD